MPYEPLERRSGPAPLPPTLVKGIASMSGHDLSGVQVHANSSLPASVGALAYTQGSEIHLAPGQDHHLPHEAWHAVQQAAGRVPVTGSVNGKPLNDHPALEREADVMGSRLHSLSRLTDADGAGTKH
jgi:hypothetical protein